MGKKSAPPAPDYTAAAEKSAAANKENLTDQTWANRANQYTPWGSQTWESSQTIDPATGKPVTQWSQNTSLTPEAQHALDSQLAMQSGRSDLANSLLPRAQQEFGQAMDWSQAQPWAQAPQAGQLDTYTNPYGFGPRGGRIQGGLDFSGVQNVEGSAGQRQKAEDAIYQSATSRLDPQWQSRQASMESDLANKGISTNSAAYSNAMRDFNQGRNDAYNQAQLSAITGAGAEAQRNYGMDMGLRQQQVGEIGQQGQFGNQAQAQRYGQSLSSGQFGLAQQQQAFGQNQAAGNQNFQQQLQAAQFQNQMRQQQLTEAMQQRGFSLNEINAIMSGQQVGMPQFSGYNQAGLAQTPDYMGAANNQYQAALNSQNASSGLFGNILGAVGGMGSAYLSNPASFSDRRVKTAIRRIGRHPRGFGIYSYRYVGERGRRVGVIAQEVRRAAPQLVRSINGVLAVDYAGL